MEAVSVATYCPNNRAPNLRFNPTDIFKFKISVLLILVIMANIVHSMPTPVSNVNIQRRDCPCTVIDFACRYEYRAQCWIGPCWIMVGIGRQIREDRRGRKVIFLDVRPSCICMTIDRSRSSSNRTLFKPQRYVGSTQEQWACCSDYAGQWNIFALFSRCNKALLNCVP